MATTHKDLKTLDKWTSLSEFKKGRSLTNKEKDKVQRTFPYLAYSNHLYDNKVMFGSIDEDFDDPHAWSYITLEDLNNI